MPNQHTNNDLCVNKHNDWRYPEGHSRYCNTCKVDRLRRRRLTNLASSNMTYGHTREEIMRLRANG